MHKFHGMQLALPERLMDIGVPKGQLTFLKVFCNHVSNNFDGEKVAFIPTIDNLTIDYNSRDVVNALSASIQKIAPNVMQKTKHFHKQQFLLFFFAL